MRAAHTDRNAEIVRLYTAERMTTAEIGLRHGLTDERVRQILKAAGVARRSKGHRSARLANESHDHPPVNDAGGPPRAADAPEAGHVL